MTDLRRGYDDDAIRGWCREAEAGKASFRMEFSGVGGQAFGSGYGLGGSSAQGAFMGGLLPGAKLDWARESGHLWRNSVVAVALGWIADVLPEARLQVTTPDDQGVEKPVKNHPLVKRMKRPNPAYSFRTLLAATALSLKVDGNAYWIKARSMGGYGEPLELWYVPHWSMYPQWPTGPTTTFISHYKYTVDGATYDLPVEDVVHFRDGLDPLFPRLGLGRLKSLLRSIVGLNEAETYTAAILKNMGIPSIMFQPAEASDEIDEAAAAGIVGNFQRQTTGENRGRPWINSLRLEAEKLGCTPEELTLDLITKMPTSLVLAALKIHPNVLGLDLGATGFDNGGQQDSGRRAAYLDCIIPLQSMMAEDGLQFQLLPDFGDPETETVGWDYSGVAALQEQANDKVTRATTAFTAGLLPRDRCLAIAGEKPVEGEEGDLYYNEATQEHKDEAAEIADGQGDEEPDNSDEASKAINAQAAAHRRKKYGSSDPHRGTMSDHEYRARYMDNKLSVEIHNSADAAGSHKTAVMRGDTEAAGSHKKTMARHKKLKAKQKRFREKTGLTVGGKMVGWHQVIKPSPASKAEGEDGDGPFASRAATRARLATRLAAGRAARAAKGAGGGPG